MFKRVNPIVATWEAAPELAIPEPPALFSNGRDLWLAYETTDEPRGEMYAVIRFREVIDFRVSPINDEGIGQHPPRVPSPGTNQPSWQSEATDGALILGYYQNWATCRIEFKNGRVVSVQRYTK